MPVPFATSDDVAAPWLPLGDTDVDSLLDEVSAQIRQRRRNIDARIDLFDTNPTDPMALDPTLVRGKVVAIVRRFLNNPQGGTSISDTTGPYSHTIGFGTAAGPESRGMVVVTDDDLRVFDPPAATVPAGSLHVRPWGSGHHFRAWDAEC